MKHTIYILIIILFSNFLNAQTNHYQDLWNKVEKFEIEGLPKSALKIVDDINKLATKDNNQPQLIKTMLFKSKFALTLEEDAQLSIISDFKNQINLSDFPTKNILESILANLYWQYFNQNRWQFYNRTKNKVKIDPSTSSGQVQDFRTWDLQTLFNEIHIHYQNSLQNGLMLQLEYLSNYDDILTNQKGSKKFRPTLFDFLSHNALEFYKTNETHITKPAYKFEIDKSKFLDDAVAFSNLKLESKDSMSLQLHALKIYQNLIQFHLKDTLPFALVDVNIQRLKFVNRHATFNNNQSLLLEAFKSESEQLKKHEISALYDFEIGTLFFQQGQKFQSKLDEDLRWKSKEALDICNTVISKFPKSNGAKKCAVLKQQIKQQSLQITTEEFLPIQKNARLLVRYKNLEKLQFQVFEISRNQLTKFNKTYNKEDKLKLIKKLKRTTTKWNSTLRNEQDYQIHSTEVLLPKLDNGMYLIFASPENNESTMAFSTIQVTNHSLVENDNENYKTFQIIDRNNGKPISNATIELTYHERNSKSALTEEYTTNQFGQIKLKKTKDWFRNITLKVKYGNDTAYFGDYYINQRYKRDKETVEHNTFLFTDRSIYRPGQTVYFKAIAMQIKGGKSEIIPNEIFHAELYDVNDDEISNLELKTNEFGSISGEFILPTNGLNGNYYIEIYSDSDKIDIDSKYYFSVEEYKRPKFETTFNPITETFKINDSVTVKGQALAYAGSNITDAKVVYRVHRKVEYPRWYFWYHPQFNTEPQEIAHGESITNDNGEFEITFKAQPDQSVDKSSLPIFKYEVTADVTDINGETRSATTIANVGYHALTANMSIANLLDKTKKDYTLNIDTNNLNGEFTPAKGTIKIYKLSAPNTVLRQRPWGAPDYQSFSKEDFNNLFPHDAYNNEQNSNNWEKEKLVLNKSFDTQTSKTLKLGKIKKWESGQYIITLESKDKFGQLVKDKIKTTLYSNTDKFLADHKLFSITSNKPKYTTGDAAILTMASAANNLSVTISIEKDHKVVKTQIVQLNNNKKTIIVPITNEDLGGFSVSYSFAVFNSFQSGSFNIAVPYPKTELEIETTTFRDKLQPGTNETWSFKIKGPQGDKVSAELLASMYDASLDQFKSHTWDFNPINNLTYYSYNRSNARRSFGTRNFRVYQDRARINFPKQYYDQLDWFGFSFGNRNLMLQATKALNGRVSGVQIVEDEMEVEESVVFMKVSDSDNLDEVVVVGYGTQKKKDLTGSNITTKDNNATNVKEKPSFDNIKIRKNLQETAFFFPHLRTDEAGHVSFSFTTPEALTQWKLQLLAHTKTLEGATKTLTTVSQKELMVIPNAPRFLREGDNITISSKIANLTEKQLFGEAVLILTDAISGKDISQKLLDVERSRNDQISTDTLTRFDSVQRPNLSVQSFTVDVKGNTPLSWNLFIPDDVQAVQYKVIAKSKDFSDGEQNVLPVLSNRMLVTETLPMWIRSNQTKTFTLDKLKNVTSTSISHQKLTLEMTSNPSWYAVQALPYLMEYPYQCNEQTFSRYYANALASHIANSNPRIQEVFNQWATQDVLISNLEKNEELKSILIQETPWLRDAQSESEQKKRIALLFDLNKMNNELQSSKRKLEQNQLSSGAWPWFNGGRENRYITQHIITGFGHLKKVGVISTEQGTNDENSHTKMIQKAISYLDAEFVKEYNNIRKYNSKVDLNKDHLSYTQLHYLYMRSFYPEIKKSKETESITKYYHNQIQKHWLKRSLYAKGLMALVVDRIGDKKTSAKIIKSLKENSINSEELGMYWKANTNSWYWYQAPIETQALLIEAFSEIENDTKTIDNLKIWLLKNKHTNRWKTTKATTDAIYALLLQGSEWLGASTERSRSVTDMVEIVLGRQKIEPSKLEDVKVEAGTGYFKTSWNTSEIDPEMADVQITKKGDGIAWGSLYWQYFEDLDKITTAKTPLKLKKKLFLKTNTDTGEEISEITSETKVKVGDLVRVRIELRSDRAMEFVHMKDMRASGLEPLNVLSKYKWQDGLGYYESTKDASTNFFFDYLPKGVYVFEYDLRVNNAGNMSNGITTIQSMYAPEFSSHSEGVRLLVK